MKSVDDAIAKAKGELEASEPQSAYGTLRWVFLNEALVEDRARFSEALRVLSGIAEPIAGPEMADILGTAADAPDDPEALYAAGYECVEQQLWWPAQSVLQRALARTEEGGEARVQVLGELVAALEAAGHHAQACERLRADPQALADRFELRYLLAFNTMMGGEVTAARLRISEVGEPKGPDQHAMAQRLQDMLARAEAAGKLGPLDRQDLRGWHFVTTGGLLLHLSPFGFDEGMHGRYAMTQDSAVRCRIGLLRLHAVLDAMDRTPERILLLPDRHSLILGRAAAAMYGLPAEPYAADKDGLVIAYDIADLEDESLAEHRAGQILFAHATCWTDPPPVCPDITTYLYQVNIAPGVDPETYLSGEPDEGDDPDDDTLEVRVQCILDAIVDSDDELPDDGIDRLSEFAEAVAPLSSALRQEGPRERLWEGGPVTSNRFA